MVPVAVSKLLPSHELLLLFVAANTESIPGDFFLEDPKYFKKGNLPLIHLSHGDML